MADMRPLALRRPSVLLLLIVGGLILVPASESRSSSSAATPTLAAVSAAKPAPATTTPPPPPPDRYPGASPLTFAAAGGVGSGLIHTPGLPCAQGGSGSSFHYDYETALPGGVLSNLTGNTRFHLDVHSEGQGAPIAQHTNGFLQGDGSRAVLENERGSLRLALQSGSCTAPSLAFDGRTASGAGGWVVESGDGAYRRAIGSGTVTINRADVAPGADNPFDIRLNGTVDVLATTLKIEVVRTYWGFLGADYALRRPTVVYKVTNLGPGDAFGVRLTNASSPTPGVTMLGSVPQALGDLPAGESEEVRIVYQFELLRPCALILLNCSFDTTLTVNLPDALDRASQQAATVRAKAPDLPPPAPETLP